MDPMSRSLENMFNVDLFALVWIAVAIVVITTLAWYFYQGLHVEDGPDSKSLPAPARPKMAMQTRWLAAFVASWWLADTLWHARAIVVTPGFWGPLVSDAAPLHWAAQLWQSNPILWDFGVLIGDGALVLALAFTWRHLPRWLWLAAAAWGVARWVLAAGQAPWRATAPIGPGGYLIAATAAYCALFPQHYRTLVGLIAASLAADGFVTAHGMAHPVHIGIAVGLTGLALAAARRWTPVTFRVLALLITVDLLLQHVGTDFARTGMNHLWAPALFCLAAGLHLDVRPLTRNTLLGG